MESYLQGLDLWNVMEGSETMPPPTTNMVVLYKWKVRIGKAMFTMKTMMEEEMLECIRKAMMPKEAWDSFMTLFMLCPKC